MADQDANARDVAECGDYPAPCNHDPAHAPPASMSVRRAVLTASIVGLLAVLAGCGHDNKDPRRGRVTTAHSNCIFGDCYTDWKVCVGPDLLVHIDDADPQDHTVTDSPECAP